MKRFGFLFLCFIVCMTPTSGHAEATETAKLYQDTETLLVNNQFDTLENQAVEYRKTNPRFPGGAEKLYVMYDALGATKEESSCGCGGYESPYTFDVKAVAIQKWITAQPQSLTARLAMAKLLISYAWAARGGGYSDTITEEMAKHYAERLQAAAAYVKGLDPKLDPQIFSIYIKLARGSQNARALMDAIYIEGTKTFPQYYHLYASRADILQEKWFGGPGELQEYTQSLLTSPGGEIGQIAYSIAAVRLFYQYKGSEVYSRTGLLWPKVRETFAVREKVYGLDNADWNVLLAFSVDANDQASAHEILPHVGTNWDKGVWHDKATFDSAVAWASWQP